MNKILHLRFLAVAMLLSSATSAWAAIEAYVPESSWRYCADAELVKQWQDAPNIDVAWQEALPAVPARSRLAFLARATATLPTELPAGAVGYNIEIRWPVRTAGRLFLNGTEVIGPVAGMRCATLFVSADKVRPGPNELTLLSETRAAEREVPGQNLAISATITRVTGDQLAFVVGPIIGHAGDDYFTVAAQTNLPTTMVLNAEGPAVKIKRESQKPGLFHSFRVSRLGRVKFEPGDYTYTVTATMTVGEKNYTVASKPTTVHAGPLGERWQFVVLGDSRTNPDRWRKVVTAAGKCNPAFIAHSGDLVASGLTSEFWLTEFYAPAADVLSRVPFYYVLGNHEEEAPLIPLIIPTPDNNVVRWAQQRCTVQLVGIDGAKGWAEGSDNYKWLEQTLAASQAKFIFLLTHYPAASSSSHSKVNAQGEYEEEAMRVCRKSLAPLCARYGVQAILAGHDHCYERSDLPGGLTAIITGGAGAPNYGQVDDWKTRNPYSKVFKPVLHYLLMDVSPSQIHMKALTPEGELLDELTWPARTPVATMPATQPAPAGIPIEAGAK